MNSCPNCSSTSATLYDWDFADGRRTPHDTPFQTVVVNGTVTTVIKPNVIQELLCSICSTKFIVRP